LADDVIVYPAHGAGSACGKNMMKETVDTLGNQKKMNYALNQPSKQAFIEAVTDGLLPPPGYFGMNVAMNKFGYDSFENVLNNGLRALTVEEFEVAAEETGAVIIDTRANGDFANGFVPQSINIGIKGDFAPWVGALIMDIKQPILLVTPPGREAEVVTRLARVGFDHTVGYLNGGIEAWIDAGNEIDTIESVAASRFEQDLNQTKIPVFDVRKEGEFQAEHLKIATHTPLDFINDYLAEFPKNEPFYLHCAGGYRSVIAASILKSRGFDQIINVEGGFNAIKNTRLETTTFVCPSTLK
jgi:rhodanese-related sulfurtransferase